MDLPDPAEVRAFGTLLLDLDGTLVEIAPTPHTVVVPGLLPGLLARLARRLDGALAILTGRPLDDLDRLLAPVRLPAAAEHGLVLRRRADGEIETVPAPEPPAHWLRAAHALVARRPGTLLERKRAGFAVHARLAPEALAEIGRLLAGLVAEDPRFELLPAAMAFEVRPRGVDKGGALRSLMKEPPFVGRRPLFVGDDVTDLDAIAAARALGGWGFRMGEAVATPADLRSWLERIANG
ncbi:MAG: trehalose-phosphatase [Geminicoccaceae bacterium]|nr:trehalose-phosphatase [Geminicoccaceae bacterium]MCX7631173.1 trehalose-phosphatase [Geminicoccaceae bacterium]MDW8341373.1 trehalose-phosphatase [Geminicoccaceae bacterium]